MFANMPNWLKVYLGVIVAAAPASVPASTNRIGNASKKGEGLIKESGLGILNFLCANTVEGLRNFSDPLGTAAPVDLAGYAKTADVRTNINTAISDLATRKEVADVAATMVGLGTRLGNVEETMTAIKVAVDELPSKKDLGLLVKDEGSKFFVTKN